MKTNPNRFLVDAVRMVLILTSVAPLVVGCGDPLFEEHAHYLSFRVVDEAGAPIAGLPVHILADYDHDEYNEFEVTTDDRGAVRLTSGNSSLCDMGCNAAYLIDIAKDGYLGIRRKYVPLDRDNVLTLEQGSLSLAVDPVTFVQGGTGEFKVTITRTGAAIGAPIDLKPELRQGITAANVSSTGKSATIKFSVAADTFATTTARCDVVGTMKDAIYYVFFDCAVVAAAE